MARNGMVSWRRRLLDQFDIGNPSPCRSEEVHILAIYDSLVNWKVIKCLLKISSCKEQGLKVDLIVTYYCMPGMTGYELLKKIKESSSLWEIPVLIMSSENVLARIDRCLEEGVEDFIMKLVKLSDVKWLRHFMTRDVADRVRSDR